MTYVHPVLLYPSFLLVSIEHDRFMRLVEYFSTTFSGGFQIFPSTIDKFLFTYTTNFVNMSNLSSAGSLLKKILQRVDHELNYTCPYPLSNKASFITTVNHFTHRVAQFYCTNTKCTIEI